MSKPDVTLCVPSKEDAFSLHLLLSSFRRYYGNAAEIVVYDDYESRDSLDALHDTEKEHDVKAIHHGTGKTAGFVEVWRWFLEVAETEFLLCCEDDWRWLKPGFLDVAIPALREWVEVGQVVPLYAYRNDGKKGHMDTLMEWNRAHGYFTSYYRWLGKQPYLFNAPAGNRYVNKWGLWVQAACDLSRRADWERLLPEDEIGWGWNFEPEMGRRFTEAGFRTCFPLPDYSPCSTNWAEEFTTGKTKWKERS